MVVNDYPESIEPTAIDHMSKGIVDLVGHLCHWSILDAAAMSDFTNMPIYHRARQDTVVLAVNLEHFSPALGLRVVGVLDLDPGGLAVQFPVRTGHGLGHDTLHVSLADQLEQPFTFTINMVCVVQSRSVAVC